MNDLELRELVRGELHLIRKDELDAQPASGPATGQGADGDELLLSSLDLVRLLVGLEEQLDVELDDAAILNGRLETIEDVVMLIQRSLPATA